MIYLRNLCILFVFNLNGIANSAIFQWYFKTGPEGRVDTLLGKLPIAPCQLGFYIPNGPAAAGKPSQTPDNDQCSNIFNSMISAARTDGAPGGIAAGEDLGNGLILNPGLDWIGASINLVQNFGSPPSSFALPGGAGTGTYQSYRNFAKG